ncbi:unnamed protein product [Rhizoctonia solani]|uniref:Uncharacterized protein n=1 Tax=Rhizoctonia solani TaxID=456999 RepID=A0A8H3BNG4_9AGAM|nr:unnamed protein product [Rhizoctonia solani]
MSSHSPAAGRNERGARQILRDFIRRAKAIILDVSDPPTPSGRIELSPPNIGSRTDTPSLDPVLAPMIGSKDSDSAAWTRLGTSLRVLEDSMELFPPLKSAVGAIADCLGTVQRAASNRKGHAALAEKLEILSEDLNQYADRIGQESSNGSIANIIQSIER